jgi:SAM-dependent methyltransferase
MTDSGMSDNDVADAFSLHAEDYDRWFDKPEGRVLFELEVKAIRLLLKGMSPPFFEIGVGSGRFAAALGIWHGVEPAAALLEMAKKRGVKVEKAFGESLPFPNGIFGGVFIIFTLCFVKEPAKVLSEAKRVLRNSGKLILGIINRESPWGELYQTKAAEGHPLYKHARFYRVKEAVALIEEVGLMIEAFSSTLRQPPSEMPRAEVVHDRFVEESGFVCIRAVKTDNEETK